MTDKSRIKVKVGDAEFEAEGNPDDVKAQYAAFLELVKAAPAKAEPPPPKPIIPGQNPAATPPTDTGILARVFERDQAGLISLKMLPPGDNRVADAFLLLLYGYRKLAESEQVFAVTLAKAARKSGVIFERTDRALEPHGAYVRSAGVRRGTMYTINNQGLNEAERIMNTLL